jgi:hypothetical protein
VKRRLRILLVATLLAWGLFILTTEWHANAAWRASQAVTDAHDRSALRLEASYGERMSTRGIPGPSITPYVRPDFAREMSGLRTTILESARRHNRTQLSGMSDHDFAVLIALILYNEHFGWFEERVTPVQALTPFYENLQRQTNEAGWSNLSVWPANIRPSVAVEILQQQVPLPHSTETVTVPIKVAGSALRPDLYTSQARLYGAVSAEISRPTLAVEYLAANLERGLYRAHFEGVPVTWRALAAWHNQGIVAPEQIRDNQTASDYVRRASAYFGKARALIDTPEPIDPFSPSPRTRELAR